MSSGADWSFADMFRFERDDVVQKISVMLYLILLFAYTTNISYAFESRHPGAEYDTYYPMMSFYLAERFYGALFFSWLAYVVPLIRGTLIYTAIIILLAAVFWLASIHVDYPGQLGFIWVAIVIDIWAQGMGMWLARASNKWAHKKEAGGLQRLIRKYFEFYPAINIEHRTERTNAFVSLVFGYSVLTILFQSRARIGLNAFLGKGILGLIQAFAFQWLYFEIDHHGVHVHAIRRHWISSTVWITCHLPFVLSYVLAAATLSKLVIAHDCDNANVEDLGETYQARSVAEIDQGLRWYYCAGIAGALLTMTTLSYCHVHKKMENSRLSKTMRLFIRIAIALTILLLPLAKGGLSSLSLIGTTTALTCVALAVDIFGTSRAGGRFWTGGWCEESKRATQYEARVKCSKKKKQEIIKALHKGETVRLEELLKRRGTNASTNSSMTELAFTEKGNHDEEWQHAAGVL
jgi:low temperature requirement protein LtrA